MTDSMLEETKAQLRERGRKLLQFVPVKEPRMETFQVLSKDPEIECFDTAKFVFTDITFDATNQDRTVVIREPDGTLRTALPEEHDRMNRIFYEKANRPILTPAVFTDPDLRNALDANRHEFVMDFACWFYEPDDPEFVKLSHTVFDRTIEGNKFSILHSTRHFGAFAFYLVLNNNIPPLLNFYGTTGSLHDAANLIRLQKIVFPNWRTEISFQDSDEKIVRDFVSQNRRLKESLPDLMKLLEEPSFPKRIPDQKVRAEKRQKFQTFVNRENVRTPDGPLGELSDEYKVKISREEGGEKNKADADGKGEKKAQQSTQQRPRRQFQKVSTLKEKLAEIEEEKNKKD
ncbi:hypothetical protein FO519_002321 [Halicephalobus sp. NKZ332]|nr:hypothetical protein FO519_002321 [Halicephalobus sp. NKZ332]